jgi:hypothetical protein
VPICAFPSVPFTTFISLSSGDQSYQIIILLPSCNTFCLYSLQSADFKCYKTEFTRAFTSETDFPRLATNPSAQWVRGHSWNPWSWSCCYLGAPGSIALLTSPSRPRNRNGKITIPSERQMQPFRAIRLKASWRMASSDHQDFGTAASGRQSRYSCLPKSTAQSTASQIPIPR